MATVTYALESLTCKKDAEEIFHSFLFLSLELIRIDVWVKIKMESDREKEKLRRKSSIKIVTDVGEERNNLKEKKKEVRAAMVDPCLFKSCHMPLREWKK